jgi:spore germination cell wall hydrolase CwlJ-like protein
MKHLAIILALALPYGARAEPAKDSITVRVVALTLLGEARGEGWGGMYFVACVIQQRSIERGKGCAKICLQPLQFSCWNGIHGDGLQLIKQRQWLFESKAAPDALRLARFIVRGHKLDRERIGFANHYCTIKTNPWWAKGRRPTGVYKNHKFYRIERKTK